ncbi:hypothetical protein NLU13_0289 [Sarocladium strictum]|uniref:DNA damage-responsive protein 48 n=1 Tax=Sarocladium strictum TaxID=5046 RepID=A0AA39GP32_SARSR|nr:hypothetical protein NLU13_0289 [Sarocladium strictum]
MDALKGYLSNDSNQSQGQNQKPTENKGEGGGFMGKLNGMAGGGAQGEKNEDALDKSIDFVQEKFLGQGDQSNESAAEQAKDEAVSDFIRGKYKDTTGSDFPIEDKEKKFGN